MVLRVGLLESDGNATFCLLRNISAKGVQLKLYGPLRVGAAASLRVGDEDDLAGCVTWVRNGMAGIQFRTSLKPDALLKVRQKMAPNRRRSSPRISTHVRATLTADGLTSVARLRDISTSGAKIRTRTPISTGSSVVVGLPRLPSFRAYVRWSDGLEAGVVFQQPIPIQVLVRWLSDLGQTAKSAPSMTGDNRERHSERLEREAQSRCETGE
jgi:hypothetical protein